VSFLYYNDGGDIVKVYVDLVLILNIAMDFLLLLATSVILKRNIKFYRIILGGIAGGISIIFLFLNLNNLELFLFKLIVSTIMVLITFSFKNIKYFFNNLLYLYLLSIILGGGIYLLDVQFNYQNNGLVFINSGFSLNVVVLVIVGPFIIYSYIKSMKKFKQNYSNLYKVDMIYKNKKYMFNAVLDTGNRLYDPYKRRPVVIVYTNKIKLNYEDSILVPYHTASGNSILKCVIVDKLIIDGNRRQNVLVGISKEKFHIEGIDMLLHNDLIGGIK